MGHNRAFVITIVNVATIIFVYGLVLSCTNTRFCSGVGNPIRTVQSTGLSDCPFTCFHTCIIGETFGICYNKPVRLIIQLLLRLYVFNRQ